MAEGKGSGGGPPNTDDVLNALAAQMGVQKTGGGGGTDSGDASDAGGDAPSASAPKPKEAAKTKAVPRSGAGAASMLMGGDDEDEADLRSDGDDDPVVSRGGGAGPAIGIAAVVLILLGVTGLLGSLASRRMAELEAADVPVDGWWELLTLYDVHQQDIKQHKLKEHEKAERAKVPVYGNMQIVSEPEFADVHVDCLPLDAKCNNVGSEDRPRWDSHWVKDEETKEKQCARDEDCRECREAAPEELKAPDFDPKALCRIYDTRCQDGTCYLPIRTTATMQGLYVGTLGGLDASRTYRVTVKLPGWKDQSYDVKSTDWTQQAIPGRDDSDRIFVKRFDLEPDPMAPPDIKAKVDAYLKKKAEEAAAMLDEMKAWQAGSAGQ